MSQTSSTQTQPSAKKQHVRSNLFNSPTIEAGSPMLRSVQFYIVSSDELIDIMVEINSTVVLEQAVKKALNRIHCPIDKNPQNYEIFMAKKNGQPKIEFPAYHMNVTLEETSNNRFTLVHVTYGDQKPKRKSTASPIRLYENNLTCLRKESRELTSPVKQSNWFIQMLGCGCKSAN